MLRDDFGTITGPHVDDHRHIHQRLNSSAWVAGLWSGSNLDAMQANVSALNLAINGAITTRGALSTGRMLTIPPGDWYINDTISVRNALGLNLRGCGLDTRLIWNGPGDRPMFKMAHCRNCRFEDLFLQTDIPLLAAVQMLRDNVPGSTVVPTMNEFNNWFILGNGKMGDGFVLGGPGSVDANNDFNRFIGCEVAGYTGAGWRLLNSQSYNNQFIGCRALTSGGQYGVATGDFNCGSFLWQGGGMAGNTVADFHLGRNYQPYRITGYNSEISARMLEIVHAMVQVEVDNSRWSAGALHEDGRAIVATPWYLNLAIRNCSIGDGATKAMTFDINPGRAWESCGFEFSNNRVYSTAGSLWLHQAPKAGTGNCQITDEGNLITIPIVI